MVNRISFQTYHSHFLEISHYQMTNRGGHEQSPSLIKTGAVPLSHHIHRGVHRVLVSGYFGEIKGRALISRSTEKASKRRGQRTNHPCPEIAEIMITHVRCTFALSLASSHFGLSAMQHHRPSRRKARENSLPIGPRSAFAGRTREIDRVFLFCCLPSGETRQMVREWCTEDSCS